jgi:hypothetical protein
VVEKGSRMGGGLGDAGVVVAELDQDPVAVAGGAHAQPARPSMPSMASAALSTRLVQT